MLDSYWPRIISSQSVTRISFPRLLGQVQDGCVSQLDGRHRAFQWPWTWPRESQMPRREVSLGTTQADFLEGQTVVIPRSGKVVCIFNIGVCVFVCMHIRAYIFNKYANITECMHIGAYIVNKYANIEVHASLCVCICINAHT